MDIHSTACPPTIQQVLLPQLGIGMQDSSLVRGHQLFLLVGDLHSQQPLLAACWTAVHLPCYVGCVTQAHISCCMFARMYWCSAMSCVSDEFTHVIV